MNNVDSGWMNSGQLTISMISSYSAPLSELRRPCRAALSASLATTERPVARRYACMFGVYGNVEDVAPTSAPMFATVARAGVVWYESRLIGLNIS